MRCQMYSGKCQSDGACATADVKHYGVLIHVSQCSYTTVQHLRRWRVHCNKRGATEENVAHGKQLTEGWKLQHE